MEIMSKRLKTLRENMNLSQARLAKEIGVTQATVNRYETGKATPTVETLLWYADHFDVSLDFIFGRTSEPQGKLYNYQPKIIAPNDEMQKFVEMCFDPQSPMNERLKQTILKMLTEEECVK